MTRQFPRSMCSRPSPGSATRSRSSWTAPASRRTRCSGSPGGRTCRRRRSCSRPPTPRPTTAPASSTPEAELPFAGHPTLGSCHAWLEAGGSPRDPDRIVQECGTGLVSVRRNGDVLSFSAPPLLRSGPIDEADVRTIAAGLGIVRESIVDATWADNGPGWAAILLRSAEEVLAIRPGLVPFDIGIVGPYPENSSGGAGAARRVAAAWVDRGGSGHGQPQRVGRPVAPLDGADPGAVHGVTGVGDRAGWAGPVTQDADGVVVDGGRARRSPGGWL